MKTVIHKSGIIKQFIGGGLGDGGGGGSKWEVSNFDLVDETKYNLVVHIHQFLLLEI